MGIPKSSKHGLIVIIVLILPEIAAQVVSQDNMSKHVRSQHNTMRVDPLNHFKKYRGGFNITDKHYWSSVYFTGIYGYVIGVLWLLCGMVCGCLLVSINFCCQSDEGRRIKKIIHCNYKIFDLSPIPLVILFLIVAMVTSGLVLAGSAKFHSQAMTSVNIIIKKANDASEIIHNATRAIENILDDLVESNISIEIIKHIRYKADKFNYTADNILNKIWKNMRIINKHLKVVFIITVVIISLNLITVTILSVFGVLRFWKVFYLFVILCWLMTVMCWLLFGLYLFLKNFSNDICTTLYDFEENPYSNSLSSIFSCGELLSAKSSLSEIGIVISIIISEVNSNRKTLFPNHVYVCNPFSASPKFLYQPQNCPPNTTQIGDIPKVLKPHICFNDSKEKCADEAFINGREYKVIKSFTSSIQTLLNIYPSLEQLLGCQLVKDALSQILLKHCKPLKKFAQLTWVGMVFLSTIMVFLVALWTIKACHDS